MNYTFENINEVNKFLYIKSFIYKNINLLNISILVIK